MTDTSTDSPDGLLHGSLPVSSQAEQIHALAVHLGDLLLRHKLLITTAESCTGGLIAAAITDVAGSSSWFEQGLVTYSNRVKHALLGVDSEIFDQHGAVSEACVVCHGVWRVTSK